MNRRVLLAASIGLVVPAGLAAESVGLGEPAGEISLAALSGAGEKFAAATGAGPTVVLFLSTRCPVSNRYNQRMIALYREFEPKGVRFLFVNSNQNEPPAEVAAHAAQATFPFPVHKDPANALADRFDAQATPESYVLDGRGILRYHGRIDDAQNPARVKEESLKLAIEALLAGREVKPAETKAFGCTIKRVRGVS